MGQRTRVICILGSSLFLSPLAMLQPCVAREYTIGNTVGARTIGVDGSQLHTLAVENRLSGTKMALEGEEFRIGWADGKETASSQFRVDRILRASPTRLEVLLKLAKPALRARVLYWAEERLPVLRKEVILEGNSGEGIVRWVEVESAKFSGEKVTYSAYADSPEDLRKIPAAKRTFSLPPLGQPVFLETVFLGLEFPGGYNWQHPDGSVRVKHYPGQAVTGSNPLKSKTAVMGFSRPGLLEDSFHNYILKIKVEPDRLRLLDFLTAARQIWPPQLPAGLATLDRVKHLFGTGGKQDVFGALSYDAGTKEYRDEGIFVPQEEGLWSDTESALVKIGMKLGMWTSFTVTNDQFKMEWARSQGYEFQHSGALCFAGPKFNAAYLKRYEELLRKHDVGLITYDVMGPGQGVVCNTPGHGHYATPVPSAEQFARTCRNGQEYLAYMEKHGGREVGREGLEAQANAMIEYLSRLRQLRPQIFLDLYASAHWLSPWWLSTWDAVHIGADAGVNLLATPYTRESLTHNRDVEYEEVFYGPMGAKFPLWGIEKYGWLVRSSYISYELKEENQDITRGWQSEMIMTMVGRGAQAERGSTDLEMMSGIPSFPPFYLKLSHWVRENRDVLRQGRMFGGRPTQYEPFGYVRYDGRTDRVLTIVRNPSMEPRTLSIPLNTRVGFQNENAEYRAWTIYPYQRLDGRSLKVGQGIELELGPYEVRVIDFRSSAEMPRFPMPLDTRFSVEQKEGQLQYRLFLEPGSPSRIRWTQSLRADQWKAGRTWESWQLEGNIATVSADDHSLPEMGVTALAKGDPTSNTWRFECINPGTYHEASVLLMRRGRIPAGDRVSLELKTCPSCVSYVSWRRYIGLTPTQYPKDLADQWYKKVIPPGRHEIELKMKESVDESWGVWVYGARRLSEFRVRYEPEGGRPVLPALLPPSNADIEPKVWTVRGLK